MSMFVVKFIIIQINGQVYGSINKTHSAYLVHCILSGGSFKPNKKTVDMRSNIILILCSFFNTNKAYLSNSLRFFQTCFAACIQIMQKKCKRVHVLFLIFIYEKIFLYTNML